MNPNIILALVLTTTFLCGILIVHTYKEDRKRVAQWEEARKRWKEDA